MRTSPIGFGRARQCESLSVVYVQVPRVYPEFMEREGDPAPPFPRDLKVRDKREKMRPRKFALIALMSLFPFAAQAGDAKSGDSEVVAATRAVMTGPIA